MRYILSLAYEIFSEIYATYNPRHLKSSVESSQLAFQQLHEPIRQY